MSPNRTTFSACSLAAKLKKRERLILPIGSKSALRRAGAIGDNGSTPILSFEEAAQAVQYQGRIHNNRATSGRRSSERSVESRGNDAVLGTEPAAEKNKKRLRRESHYPRFLKPATGKQCA